MDVIEGERKHQCLLCSLIPEFSTCLVKTCINDYVPEETDIRAGAAQVTGKICVIGAELKEDKLKELFGV